MMSAEETLLTQLMMELDALRSENSRLRAQLEQSAAELQQLKDSNVAKDHFVSHLSHDLRAPLANIKLYVGLLKKGNPEKREEYHQVLSQQTMRLQKMLDDLLDISRLDMGKTEFHWTLVDLNSLLDELAVEWQPTIASRGLQLRLELASLLPPITADPALLKQAVAHVWKNARDYAAPDGDIVCRTAVCQIAEQPWITLSTENSGLGLSEDEIKHVGERLYRGRVARQYKVEGTGLGLAICREIVVRHEGRLTIDSVPGRSVTFTIWLKPAA
jgi:signal transduction histidine kinase